MLKAHPFNTIYTYRVQGAGVSQMCWHCQQHQKITSWSIQVRRSSKQMRQSSNANAPVLDRGPAQVVLYRAPALGANGAAEPPVRRPISGRERHLLKGWLGMSIFGDIVWKGSAGVDTSLAYRVAWVLARFSSHFLPSFNIFIR